MALSDEERLRLLELEEQEYQYQKTKGNQNDSNTSSEATPLPVMFDTARILKENPDLDPNIVSKLKEQQNIQDTQMAPRAEAVRAGATESFPFMDRFGALTGSLGAKAGGDARDFGDIYNEVLPQVRQQQAASLKSAREDYPELAYSAQALGSLAIPMPGGSVVSNAANIGKLGLGAGLKEAAIQGLKQAPALGTLGAVYGASGAEDLANIPDVALRAGTGAATGMLLSPVVGAGTELVKRGIKGAIPVAKSAFKALGELSPRLIGGPVEAFETNIQPGVSSVTEKGRQEIANRLGKSIEKPVSNILEFNKTKINQLTDGINSITKQIQALTDKGATEEAKAVMNAQLNEMQSILSQIEQVGQAAGRAVGEPFEIANKDQKTTGALLAGVKKFRQLIEDNPNLAGQEAQDILSVLESKVKAPDTKVKFTNKQVMDAEGELQKAMETLSATGKYSPEQLAAAKEQALALMKKPSSGKLSEGRIMGPEGELLGSSNTKVSEVNVPGKELETASVPTYREFVADLRNQINQPGISPSTKRALIDTKESIEQQGRRELLGSGAEANAEAAKQYAKYKDVLESLGVKESDNLPPKMVDSLMNIAKDPTNLKNLNAKQDLIKQLTSINPELAASIENSLASLQEKQAAIPKSTPSEKLANLFENTLPKKELQTAAEKQGVDEALLPLKRYTEPSVSESLINKGSELGSEIQNRRATVESLKDSSKVLGDIQGQQVKRLDIEARLNKLIDNIKESAGGGSKGEEAAKTFLDNNKILIRDFRTAVVASNPNIGRYWNLLGAAAAKVARPLAAGVESAQSLVKSIGAAAKATIPSRFQKLQQWSSELEARGLPGIPDIAQEAASSDIAKKAALIFNASQSSSKFRNLTKEDE